uniref:WD repeat domain 1 n=1 Tax=Molossus molossus TaxID=27622 RepID=A0A7J8K305_MOLMO|nr:WD repeat domain 1 [Molossus molossus]
MPYEIKKVFASLPQVERGVSKIIGGDPKGNNFLYTNGKCVILRNIDNPALADIYTEHAHQVVVAKYAPSGFYIASGACWLVSAPRSADMLEAGRGLCCVVIAGAGGYF